ncbi:MAG TPA: YggL family protein [Rhodocyclaceae bacterium]|nr:YggL family protein [Rhodocyclaceae bacterium]
MAKHRSARLRKKLHAGEFLELGFEVKAQLQHPLSDDAAEAFIDAFLVEVIEARGLLFGGWVDGGYVTRSGSGSATEEDRATVRAWFAARSEIASVAVSPLGNARA